MWIYRLGKCRHYNVCSSVSLSSWPNCCCCCCWFEHIVNLFRKITLQVATANNQTKPIVELLENSHGGPNSHNMASWISCVFGLWWFWITDNACNKTGLRRIGRLKARYKLGFFKASIVQQKPLPIRSSHCEPLTWVEPLSRASFLPRWVEWTSRYERKNKWLRGWALCKLSAHRNKLRLLQCTQTKRRDALASGFGSLRRGEGSKCLRSVGRTLKRRIEFALRGGRNWCLDAASCRLQQIRRQQKRSHAMDSMSLSAGLA